jgi:hypothetical protein
LPYLSQAQCKALRKKKDKTTGGLTITTDPKEPVHMVKRIDNTSTTYYLTLSAPASGSGDRTGVFLMVADKALHKWPDQVVTVTATRHRAWWGNPLTATSTVVLSPDQVPTFTTNRIRDYELGEFDWVVKDELGEKFRQQVECLVKVNLKNGKKRNK